MPRDGFLLPKTDPTELRFQEADYALFQSWQASKLAIEDAQAEIVRLEAVIAGERASMEECVTNATKLRDAAALLGVSFEEMPQQIPHTVIDPEFSIKNYVVDRARAAHPNPIRAAAIRDEVRDLGHDIHDKTIGMSLYRWSQKGVLRREGKADWYYIPVAERVPGSALDGHDDLV